MSPSMKAVVQFLVVQFLAVGFVIAPSAMANARTVACAQALQDANNLAAAIASAAPKYWTHRQNFVNYKYGKLSKVANSKTLAATEMSLGTQLSGLMSSSLASFQTAIATVRALNCESAAALQPLIEATTTNVRTIHFGRFPVNED